LPVESPLPNILGLTFASQYATRIRNSLPQLFESDGKTVRSPAIDFLPLGTGDSYGITRKAPMSLLGSAPSTPFYQLNLGGIGGGNLDFYEDPSSPTIVQGGHFLNVNASNNGTALNSQQFFFDTGASVTVLSELTALQLGIDVQTDAPDFTLEILGRRFGRRARVLHRPVHRACDGRQRHAFERPRPGVRRHQSREPGQYRAGHCRDERLRRARHHH
jgi:hypothetical protein